MCLGLAWINANDWSHVHVKILQCVAWCLQEPQKGQEVDGSARGSPVIPFLKYYLSASSSLDFPELSGQVGSIQFPCAGSDPEQKGEEGVLPTSSPYPPILGQPGHFEAVSFITLKVSFPSVLLWSSGDRSDWQLHLQLLWRTLWEKEGLGWVHGGAVNKTPMLAGKGKDH